MSHTSGRRPRLLSGCGVVYGCECLAASSHRHGGAAAAARPVGAHAGPACPGGGAVAGCDDVRSRLALRCRAATCTMRSDEDRPAFAKRHLGGLDHQVKEMAAAGVQFGRWALTQDPALALKISQAASPCARPPMASSLTQDKMGQARVRCTEDATSSPQKFVDHQRLHRWREERW